MIRVVCAFKTTVEDRSVIKKECATIQASISENHQDCTHRNLMLGYPTHFGQMECLKVIALSKFPEKRIGYIGSIIIPPHASPQKMQAHLIPPTTPRSNFVYFRGLFYDVGNNLGGGYYARGAKALSGRTLRTTLFLIFELSIQLPLTKTCREPFSVCVHSDGLHGVQDWWRPWYLVVFLLS